MLKYHHSDLCVVKFFKWDGIVDIKRGAVMLDIDIHLVKIIINGSTPMAFEIVDSCVNLLAVFKA